MIFLFNTSCTYCEQSIPQWQHLTAQISDGYPATSVGISLDSVEVTQQYVEIHGIGYPAISVTDARAKSLIRGAVVPQTLIADHEGRVVYARAGLVTVAAADSILSVLAAHR